MIQQKYTFILLLLLMIFVISCKNDSNEITIISSFPVEELAKIDTTLTSPVLLAPEEMFILNNQIWVYQNRKDTIFDVFELPNCNYLFSTGQKGPGPNDFIFPSGRTIEVKDGGFFILDMNILKFIKPDLDGSLKTVYSKETFDNIPINGFIRLNDSLNLAFVGCADGIKTNYEYKIRNIHNSNIKEFSLYPTLTNKEYEPDERCQIYYKYMTSNLLKERFVSFYAFFKYLRFYNYDGYLEKEVYVKVPPYNSNDVEDWEKRVVYYGPPVSTNQYIYAPCMGNEIQVWDWNGNPIIRYSLTQRFLTFAVSESLGKIYLISSKEDDENKIFSFDLSHLD